MQKVFTDNDVFKSGAFILNQECVPYAPHDGLKTIFLTQDGNLALKEEILKIINCATTVLKICSFIITDNQIFEAVKKKVESNEVAVFILTQLDTSKISNTTLVTEEEAKDQTNLQHLSYIKMLYDKGAHVRASTSAHAKFLVADRNVGFIMSANFTTPSLILNTESGAYLTQKCAQHLDKLFDVVFQKGTTYRKYITAARKNKQFIIQSDIYIKQEWLPNHQESKLRYTYEKLTNNLLDEIINIIKSAKQFIYLSTYSVVALEHLKELTEEISKAINRGVTVRIFCRGMNFRSDHLRGVAFLNTLGCKIYGDYYNHSKGIINENSAMLFTANIDGIHGLNNGFEVGFLLDDAQRLEFLELHKRLISMSIYKFIRNPKRLELFSTYKLYEKSKGIKPPEFEKELSLSIKDGIYHSKEELEEQPLFFARRKGKSNENFIVTGNNCYKCDYSNGNIVVREKINIDYNMEKYLIKYQNLKIEYT